MRKDHDDDGGDQDQDTPVVPTGKGESSRPTPQEQALIDLVTAVESRGGIVKPKAGPPHVHGAVGEQALARMYIEACRQLGRTPIIRLA